MAGWSLGVSTSVLENPHWPLRGDKQMTLLHVSGGGGWGLREVNRRDQLPGRLACLQLPLGTQRVPLTGEGDTMSWSLCDPLRGHTWKDRGGKRGRGARGGMQRP